MFVVEIGSVLTTIGFVRDLFAGDARLAPLWFTGGVACWLWFTVLFANFAEAVAEGRGKAQADTPPAHAHPDHRPPADDRAAQPRRCRPTALVAGDQVVVEAGELIPSDGEVIEGVASVDESAITGESAPVIRESGGDRSAVTGGTKVLSDRIVVRITAKPGETFLDRMIALVEGASRQKTPNEIALHILLVGLTLVFLFACVTLVPLALYGKIALSSTVIVALLVCLIPTTIGGLLSAIGIAGMDRLIRKNVIAMSGRAIEAAGDVDVLLLDKTGTITMGNRMATELAPRVRRPPRGAGRRRPALQPRRRDARGALDRRARQAEASTCAAARSASSARTFIPFSAQTRMSGCDLDGRRIRKGAVDAVGAWVKAQRAAPSRRSSKGSRTGSPTKGGRRWRSPTAAASWASSA